MRAGKLKDRVLIQQKSTVPDAWGQPAESWTDVITDTPDHRVSAHILSQNGKEFISASKGISQVSASIRIRYRTGITAGMRAVHGADIYNIAAVLLGDNRGHIDLVATLGANEG
jgi:SPP1 family predicted phage head-tail adaptor